MSHICKYVAAKYSTTTQEEGSEGSVLCAGKQHDHRTNRDSKSKEGELVHRIYCVQYMHSIHVDCTIVHTGYCCRQHTYPVHFTTT